MSLFQRLFCSILHPASPRCEPQEGASCFVTRELIQKLSHRQEHQAHPTETTAQPLHTASGDVATSERPLEDAERFYGVGVVVAKALGIRARLGFLSRRAIVNPKLATTYVAAVGILTHISLTIPT